LKRRNKEAAGEAPTRHQRPEIILSDNLHQPRGDDERGDESEDGDGP
jgi:hypothetical protein